MDNENHSIIVIFCLVFALMVGGFATHENVAEDVQGCDGMVYEQTDGQWVIDPIGDQGGQPIGVADTWRDSEKAYWYKCPDGTFIVPEQPNEHNIPDRIVRNQRSYNETWWGKL